MPYVRAKRVAEQRAFEQRYRDFQLFSLKKYHPAFRPGGPLEHLSYEEIRKRFNVTDCYHGM
jgi:hypothetical protein